MSIISDHRPHVPWRKASATITRKRDGRIVDVDLHVADEPSIHEWLTSGDRAPSAPELPPSVPLLPLGRRQVTVYRELDDDEALARQLLTMEQRMRATADALAAENDARMERLLEWSAVAARRAAMRVQWVQGRFASGTFARRRAEITPLVRELGYLLASGDVDPVTAAGVMGLRSRFLSSPDDSQRLPRLTPELLAVLDAERDARTVVAQ